MREKSKLIIFQKRKIPLPGFDCRKSRKSFFLIGIDSIINFLLQNEKKQMIFTQDGLLSLLKM